MLIRSPSLTMGCNASWGTQGRTFNITYSTYNVYPSVTVFRRLQVKWKISNVSFFASLSWTPSLWREALEQAAQESTQESLILIGIFWWKMWHRRNTWSHQNLIPSVSCERYMKYNPIVSFCKYGFIVINIWLCGCWITLQEKKKKHFSVACCISLWIYH